MKVIKAPQDLKTWRQQCSCPRCRAELEYEVDDLTYVPGGGDMRENWPESYTIRCAVCTQVITVPSNIITEYIKHTLISKQRRIDPYDR
jgi:hypothetical protein